MKSRIVAASLSILVIGMLMIPAQAQAQWSIGASYEIREEEPQNGFGARIERQILGKLPLVKLGLRAHFSYFSEENELSSGGATYSTDLTNYDFGLAAIGGISLGLLKPYVGLGLGSTTFDVSAEDVPGAIEDDTESKVYWNALVGAEVSPIPALKPFVEYRFESVEEPDFAPGSSGRVIFGLSIAF